MIAAATYISILISVGSLAWGYAPFDFVPLSRWLLYFGVVWFFARWQKWWWFSAIALIVTVIAAAFGMWFGLSPGWMLSSGNFALIAWDLNDYRRRTRFEKQNEELRDLERRRIRRLTLLAIAGLLLSSITMWMRGQFNSEWAGFLIVIFLLWILQFIQGKRTRKM